MDLGNLHAEFEIDACPGRIALVRFSAFLASRVLYSAQQEITFVLKRKTDPTNEAVARNVRV